MGISTNVSDLVADNEYGLAKCQPTQSKYKPQQPIGILSKPLL